MFSLFSRTKKKKIIKIISIMHTIKMPIKIMSKKIQR
jgi:hypothetical protein